jgi:hypothetical protein
MKIMTIVGIVLIGLGVVGLIYGGISYTSNKNVVDMGAMHMQVEQKKEIPLSPFAGAAAVVIGVVLILVDRRRSAPSGDA